ncbi:MAG: anaerobic ribonucleoside-triphosphate reductase activating protein [Clostridia bacterium]|nr:anaerobic ribonucleoside-triphosphate reductase activating protein [Clostridia bacterium]
MNYANIKQTDVANGPGVRVTLFVSGCRRHCPECFNPETWDFHYGELYTRETEALILAALKPDYIAGLTLLGGEPLEPENQPELLRLVERVRAELPGKTIWCYSGARLERDILPMARESEVTRRLLEQIDVLVDGEFVAARKNLRIRFRGSENQRLLDMPKTLAAGEAVLWEG